MSLLFPQVPLARVAWLRILVAAMVIVDVLINTTDPIGHGDVPEPLYRPLIVRELLGMPAPTPVYVEVLRVVLLVSALVMASGRLPRLSGAVCAAAMLDWMSNAYSYSKIDHDHFALMVALLVLPTVGRARIGDVDVRSAAAGWAVRMIQVAAVATYFLSAAAKMRFGGWGWANGAIFVWAFERRGNGLALWLSQHPPVVIASQWALLILEFLSPILLWLRGRGLAIALAVAFGFHILTMYLLSIHFLPLVVCLFAFVPLERLVPWWRARRDKTGAPGSLPVVEPHRQ